VGDADPRYKTSEWKRVRRRVLDRDGYVCQIRLDGCLTEADQVDHIVPAAAGGEFYDDRNLRACCRRCNSKRARRTKVREGWRRADTVVMLVVGPPGAGKSTYVREQASPRDVVVDYDRIAQALGSPVTHGHANHEAVMAARGAVLRRLRRGELDAPRAWIVSSNPAAEEMFPHHELVVIDPGEDEVLRRCDEAGRPSRWSGLVRDWYAKRSVSVPDGLVAPSREW